MHRDSQSAQEPPSTGHSSVRSSRWLVVAVALCGALAGGSIVETIAALASGSSISISPGHFLAEPLVLAGVLSGGLLAAVLASRDRSTDQTIADSLAPADIVPSEPMLWQPTPLLLPTDTTLAASSAPSARSRHRVRYTHRRIPRSASHESQTRSAVSRSAAMMNAPRHP